MSDTPSIAWLLSPEELVAACAAVGIAGLPHSRWVDEAVTHDAFVPSVGSRSLQAARLASLDDGVLAVEPTLAAALLSLTGQGHDAVASFAPPGRDRHVATFAGGLATSMIESPDGVEIVLEAAQAGLGRLQARTDAMVGMAEAMRQGPGREPGQASLARERWNAIAGGRPPRRADAALAAKGAVAAHAHGTWGGGSLRVLRGGGYVGELCAWVFDDRGALSVELGPPDETGEVPVLVATVDLARDVAALWKPVRDALGSGAPPETQADTRRPVSHA